MKTREQRRQRRPLGSVFVGQAPQKRKVARGGVAATVCMTAEAERKKNVKKTGSTAQAPAARLRFCGPSPTKTEPSGICLMLVAHYGWPMGQKGLPDGQQVYMPNMAKKMAKNCQKTHKIHRKSSKRHHDLAN